MIFGPALFWMLWCIFIAFVFVMINFIVDILYYFIDPRIRVKAEAASG